MLKAKLIMFAIKAVMWITALGVGIWYMSSAISGASLTYTSLPGFLKAIGVENGDIASANGCFLCGYIEQLFATIGNATEMFWIAMLDNLWILMAIGFGIFLIYKTITHLLEASKKNVSLDEEEKKIDFSDWFDGVWKQGARVMIAGALMGAIGLGGTFALKQVTNITIAPVMFVGAQLSMAATGVVSAAECGTGDETDDVLNPVLKPFMCTMGNLNTVMLAGAAGGFALMNYSWMGMGGGLFTWLAGLALIIMFLIIGFDLFFQILSVIFKLVFLIIFLPFIIAAWAFEPVWELAKGVFSNAINMLVKSAVRILAISLKIIIIYTTVSFAADEFFPGPMDGYNAIMPPLIETGHTIDNNQALMVSDVFARCETVGLASGEMDKQAFVQCFNASKAQVERTYPGAFDFMGNGLEFILFMIGIFFLYYYIVSPKIDLLLGKDEEEGFDFGGRIKSIGKRIWGIPEQVGGIVTKGMGKGK